MKRPNLLACIALAVLLMAGAGILADDGENPEKELTPNDCRNPRIRGTTRFVRVATIFRFDTFGSEAFWGGGLHLHETIAGAANGGVGPGLSPGRRLARLKSRCCRAAKRNRGRGTKWRP